MAGVIHRCDVYGLREYEMNDVMTFIDIGANKGTTTVMAHILYPFARIIAIEPCVETFNQLKCLKRSCRQIEYYNIALGKGEMCLHKSPSHSGLDRFLECSNKEHEHVKGKLLSEIFDEYKIDTSKPYIIKIDCEGSERYLIDDEKAVDIINNSLKTVIELHLQGWKNYSLEEWNKWVGNFNLRLGIKGEPYTYIKSDTIPDEKTPLIELRRKT